MLHTGLLTTTLAAGVACGGNRPLTPVGPSEAPTATGASAPPSAAALPACAPAIESFSAIEFSYPGYPGWYYAPKVKVSCPAGTGGVAVTRVELVIPGLPAAPPACTYLRVEGGQSRDLFGELYGDYEFSIDNGTARATDEEATVSISFTDGAGVAALLAARGPILPGGLPAYSGGRGSGWGSCR